MKHNIWLYIFLMAGVSYLIRVIPFTLFRKQIKSTFIKSFLYYVPYATLAVMTFPAILGSTKNPLPSAAAFILGIVAAYFKAGLFKVAVLCCLTVLGLSLLGF